jgi:hypothetical protein
MNTYTLAPGIGARRKLRTSATRRFLVVSIDRWEHRPKVEASFDSPTDAVGLVAKYRREHTFPGASLLVFDQTAGTHLP